MQNNYKIVIEKFAKSDLIEIYNYIANTLVNKEAAINLLNRINNKFILLSLFPKSSPIINNEYVNKENLRKTTIDNYIIFYEINEEHKEIIIIRIISNMMNYIDIL